MPKATIRLRTVRSNAKIQQLFLVAKVSYGLAQLSREDVEGLQTKHMMDITVVTGVEIC